jgi:hypothetical protein
VSNESEPWGGRSLASYIETLFAALEANDAAAGQRVRQLAGSRTARIKLDEEEVLTTFVDGQLQVRPADPSALVHGHGATDRDTVVDLLTGRVEAFAALLSGRLEIVGEPDAVAGMLQIIETLLDAAPRVAELQLLERELVAAHARATLHARQLPAWYPAEITRDERSLLARLDLLPDEPDH